MSFRAVFFDFGGVIVRTEYQAPREHLAERLNIDYEDLVKLVFDGETARRASVGQLGEEEHWRTVARKLGRPAGEIDSIRAEFFAGDVLDRTLVEFIASLRPRYKTGVISNAWPSLRAYLTNQKLDGAFDTLIISAEVGVMKPDAKIYQIARQQAAVEAGEAIFVDDALENIEAANALGMHGILFRDQDQVLGELRRLLT
jgi:epoxide hydrolase-like predicted phosphatase